MIPKKVVVITAVMMTLLRNRLAERFRASLQWVCVSGCHWQVLEKLWSELCGGPKMNPTHLMSVSFCSFDVRLTELWCLLTSEPSNRCGPLSCLRWCLREGEWLPLDPTVVASGLTQLLSPDWESHSETSLPVITTCIAERFWDETWIEIQIKSEFCHFPLTLASFQLVWCTPKKSWQPIRHLIRAFLGIIVISIISYNHPASRPCSCSEADSGGCRWEQVKALCVIVHSWFSMPAI